MDRADGAYAGTLVVDRDLLLEGQVTGDCIVADTVHLIQRGDVGGDLHIHGGLVDLHGSVAGDVVLHKGDLAIWGRVGGRVIEHDGFLSIRNGAVVAGA